MKCAEICLNLGAFVLGGLEPEEAAEVRRHLASCSGCRNELQELEKVHRALKSALPPADSPSYLKDEVLSRVRAEELSSSRELRFKNLRFGLPGVAAVALVAMVALGVFFGLQTDPPLATIQLLPADEKEEYWGVAELHPQPSGNQQVELKLNNLGEPGPYSFYEMWFVSGGKHISAGTFTADPGGTEVRLSAPPQAQDYHTLLITEESATDDTAPSEEVELRGEMP